MIQWIICILAFTLGGIIGNVLINGAGPGLSAANARELGRAGHTIHLLGRSSERLSTLAGALREDGVEVATHVGDVASHDEFADLVRSIDTAAPLEACIHQPGVDESTLLDILDTTAANIRPMMDSVFFSAVALAEVLVPRMIARGRGSIIFVGGGSAKVTIRQFGNLNPPSAALRSFVLTLAGALQGSDVHASFYMVAGMIDPDATSHAPLSPAYLAERIRRLVEDHDVAEVVMGPEGEVLPRSLR